MSFGGYDLGDYELLGIPDFGGITLWSIGGELYSTVGVETPIDSGRHLYQITRTPTADLRHP